MTAKVCKKIKRPDVQMHIDKAYDIINEHLTGSYVSKVQKKLRKRGLKISDSMVRNVKNRIGNNPYILKALVEVALEAKEQKDALQNLINKF